MFPYDVLGLQPKLKKKAVIHPEVGRVKERFYDLMKEAHPGTPVRPSMEPRFRTIMAAGLFLLSREGDEYRNLNVADLLDVEVPPYDAEIPPIERLILEIALPRIQDLIGECSNEAAATKRAAKELGGLPEFVLPDKFAGVPEVDVARILEEEIGRGDFFSLRTRFPLPDVIWRRGVLMEHGHVVAGKVVVLNAKARAAHPLGAEKAPHAQCELSLAWWLVADREEHHRAIYHLLSHLEAKSSKKGWYLKTRIHEVGTWVNEIKVFGLADKHQGAMVAEALKHPTTEKRLRTWDLVTGQLSFLSPEGRIEMVG